MKNRPFFTFTDYDEPERAFRLLVDQYRRMHPDGHSGTIAEKSSFALYRHGKHHPMLYAALMVGRRDPRIRDPYGPAGCVIVDDALLFYGFAVT